MGALRTSAQKTVTHTSQEGNGRSWGTPVGQPKNDCSNVDRRVLAAMVDNCVRRRIVPMQLLWNGKYIVYTEISRIFRS
jgi:hypothetical protein